MCFVSVEIVKFTHVIAPVLKRKEDGAGRMETFGTGVAIPFVILLPASRSQSSTALSCGRCDHGVVAT